VPPPLLDIRDLRTEFETRHGWIPAVDGASLRVSRGKVTALVGESGCGKSATALSILRLIPTPPGRIAGGEIRFADPDGDGASEDLLSLDDRAMRRIRGNRIAMIFQEPMTALNPVFSIGEQIVEVVELHQLIRGRRAWEAAIASLRAVGIPDPQRRVRDFPHQFSGGMRQRVMIAMALACRPAMLIADEPTTALDVTVQQQVLALLRRLQDERGLGILLITHDLGVVAQVADDVYVMYAGRIVEHGPVADVLQRPLHPYTQGLLRCTPRLTDHRSRWETIPGTVPDAAHLPTGCRFHPRCRLTVERAAAGTRTTLPVNSQGSDRVLHRCVEEHDGEPSGAPILRELLPGRFVACWEADEAP